MTTGDGPADEARVLFALAKDADGSDTVVLLVPRAAWVYMKEGKNHNFDFTKAGLPLRIVMAGCKDRAHGVQMIEQMNNGFQVAREADFSKDFGLTVAPYETATIRGKDD